MSCVPAAASACTQLSPVPLIPVVSPVPLLPSRCPPASSRVLSAKAAMSAVTTASLAPRTVAAAAT